MEVMTLLAVVSSAPLPLVTPLVAGDWLCQYSWRQSLSNVEASHRRLSPYPILKTTDCSRILVPIIPRVWRLADHYFSVF